MEVVGVEEEVAAERRLEDPGVDEGAPAGVDGLGGPAAAGVGTGLDAGVGGTGAGGAGCGVPGVDGTAPEGSGGAAAPNVALYQGCRSMASTSHSTLFQITCTHAVS